jgi:hypothetical protein
MSASAPPAISRNVRLPRKSASPSFIAVFASTPTAIAVAATAGEPVRATPLAIDAVRASTSVSPRIAADVMTPDDPHHSRATNTTMSTT